MFSMFIYAFIISFIITILVIYLSAKYDLFIDDSQSNKPQNFHTHSTPRAGGFGILTSTLLIVMAPLGIKLLPSVILAFLSGIFEDLHNSLSPKLRLFLQFIVALCTVWLTDSVVTYLGLGITMPYWIGVIFSVFAIVGMMNAVNIIDGFNGLASGTILLILLSFCTIAYKQNSIEILSIILITLGATLGFFVLNFPKGKIFLGDGGAYLLGFIVAAIGIFLASRYEGVSPWYIMTIFIYPVWEVLFSIGRRILLGNSAFDADANHLHTLIYKYITHNNPLTALLVLSLIAPFMILATLYAHSSIINISIALVFIVIYVVFYQYLYRKNHSQ